MSTRRCPSRRRYSSVLEAKRSSSSPIDWRDSSRMAVRLSMSWRMPLATTSSPQRISSPRSVMVSPSLILSITSFPTPSIIGTPAAGNSKGPTLG